MLDSTYELLKKVNEYHSNKDDNKNNENWDSLKQILCLLGNILKLVANDLPDKLKWLSSSLTLVAGLLELACKNL